MIERAAIEYVINCAWQIPLLAAGAWLLVKIVRPQIWIQHWLWVSLLAMAVLLPLRGIEIRPTAAPDAGAGALQPRTIDFERTRLGQPNQSVKRGDSDTPVQRRRRPLLRNRRVQLSHAATHWIAGLYAAVAAFCGLRFVRTWLAARRLVKESTEAVLSPESMRGLERYAEKIGVALPVLRQSSRIAGPAIVGCARPVLLLPVRFCEHAEEEVRAALLHELAHIKRRDYTVNLVCQVVALPVAWHPAIFAIQQRIRRTREMVCDRMAAEEMQSGAGYARCLVSLAQRMLREQGLDSQTQALGLFDNHTIEERVMGLTETKAAMSVWGKAIRIASGTAAMAAVTMAAAAFHVIPAFAEPAMPLQSASVAVAQTKPSAQVADPVVVSQIVSEAENRPTAIARGKHATVTAQKGDYIHRWKAADGEPFTMVNHTPEEPTAEEKLSVEAQLKDSQREMDGPRGLLIDPKFTLRTDAFQKNLGRPEFQKQIEEINKKMNDPAFKKQMEELQKKLPEFSAQANLAMAESLNGNVKLQMQLDGLKNFQPNIDLKQFEFENDALNADSFKLLMDGRMKDVNEQMAKAQNELESGEMKRKLEAAEQMLQDVKRQMEKIQAK